MKLRALHKGESGIITAVQIQGCLGHRLREMGFVPGTQVTVEGRAPLRDPVRLRLKGQSITLRKGEADHIEVQRGENDA